MNEMTNHIQSSLKINLYGLLIDFESDVQTLKI